MRQFAALISFVVTNAILAYQHFHPQRKGMLHRDFRPQLAKALVKNPLFGTTRAVLCRDLLVDHAEFLWSMNTGLFDFKIGSRESASTAVMRMTIGLKTKHHITVYPMCDSRLFNQDCFI